MVEHSGRYPASQGRSAAPSGLSPEGGSQAKPAATNAACERRAYTWVALAKDCVCGPPWNYYVLDLDGKEMALCQMPDGEQHAEEIVNALNEDDDRFNLRWDADMRAIKRWQEAHPGNDMVWPDHADLVVWLLERLDATRRTIAFGYTHIVDGRPVNPLKNGEKCDHGRHEWEDCIGCYDEALLAALDGRDSGSRPTGEARLSGGSEASASPKFPSNINPKDHNHG
jgi:hypothetical protein